MQKKVGKNTSFSLSMMNCFFSCFDSREFHTLYDYTLKTLFLEYLKQYSVNLYIQSNPRYP